MSRANDISLADGVVRIWFATPDIAAVSSAPELTQQLEILSLEEHARYSSFKFDIDRIHYLCAHSMLRQILSQFVGCNPQDLRFNCNPYGKPFLDRTHCPSAIEFNLTHTDGMVACALSRHPVGLDAERITRKIGLEIASSVLAEAELSDLERTPASERIHRLLEFWTLKEAFIKATGNGLSQPLDHFWFELITNREPRIHFLPGEPYHADLWRFAQLKEASPAHEMAIAAALPPGQKLSIRLKRFEWRARNHPQPED